MNMDIQQESPIFINEVDKSMRENILGLDQKLKSLRTEMHAKLYGSVDRSNQGRLLLVIEDINLAINALASVVDLIVGDAERDNTELFYGFEMEHLSHMMLGYVEKITRIKEEL